MDELYQAAEQFGFASEVVQSLKGNLLS